MSDSSVAAALRSEAPLIVVEAPAGCGKTYQAAEYTHWLASNGHQWQVLILTHSHAACDVFRERTKEVRHRVHITTIDGLVAQIASMYHLVLGIPLDAATWAHSQPNGDGFEKLAEKACELLFVSQAVCSTLASRYPIILCDEHQDANTWQHRLVMTLHKAGAKLRIFADPVQAIFVKKQDRPAHKQQWEALCKQANTVEQLDYAHRWTNGSPELGRWILAARQTLKNAQPIDLRGDLPKGLQIIVADNISPRHGGFLLGPSEGRLVNRTVNANDSLMILAGQNQTVATINAYLGRRVPIWEGHTRNFLSHLVAACQSGQDNPVTLAEALVVFVNCVATGFNKTFSDRFLEEIASACTKPCKGKPARLQAMARHILNEPNHLGVTRALALLRTLQAEDVGFREIRFNLLREFREAILLNDFTDCSQGLAEIAQRRSISGVRMPTKVISTVHKAKGLECSHALLMPCDKTHFGNSDDKRCLLYVALSRAKESLTLVISPTSPSQLLIHSSGAT
ncbi:UvrD-helicase domain-containing protein [Janthinobacterium sp. B9-8]|uniref:UvrD-helicase domain-containing protein n=1 Tax=Janthinobacterium sp. B9-8 TaxID=1236179 RepID=UPI00061CEE7C|nr:UvrD-helicase domain-containing protein [Janthinobacterium sp. B9-8]AMC35280.1 hypothetical protein VN23_12010 [Janthinobacterium sp. B9-8]